MENTVFEVNENTIISLLFERYIFELLFNEKSEKDLTWLYNLKRIIEYYKEVENILSSKIENKNDTNSIIKIPISERIMNLLD